MWSQLQILKQQVTDYGELHPGLLFAGIVVLPAFGFPASALLLLAGIVWGSNPASCAIALGAIFLNIIVTHSFAAGPGKQIISRFLGARLKPWERFSAADHAKVTWLVRVTPGIPLFVQNYLLGFLGIPLRQSLLVALPVTGLYVCGFVLTGGAIFDGTWGLAITGVCLVAAAAFAARLMRKNYPASGMPAP